MFRARSIFLGGVEGRAVYQIGGIAPQTLYTHWNNPTVGGNSYHTNAPAGFYSFWSAPTSGSDPVAHFVLRPAGTVETDFLPEFDGFRFRNKWPDPTPYSLPPLRDSPINFKYGNAGNGLCGGMVLAALDYFAAGQEIPDQTTPPRSEPDPLFLHLVDRLFDTFSVDSVTLLLKLMNPLYPDDDSTVLNTFGLANGRAAVMAHEEWPLIRADIDAGRPSPVCIVTVKSLNPGELGKNHQLLAYAYTVNGHDVTLHLYDPNQPRENGIFMRFNDGDVSQRIVVEHNIAVSGRPVYCFVRMEGGTRHVPFATRPRLTGLQRRARRVHIARQDETLLGSQRVGEGRRLAEVYPDCGEKPFPYTVDAQELAFTLEAATPYYRWPVLRWTINGVGVAPGAEREVFVPADAMRPEGAPPRPPRLAGDPDEGHVRLHVTVEGNQLRIRNAAEDGNYALAIQVSAQDGTEPDSTSSRSTVIDVLGMKEDLIGWYEASSACWAEYLRRHQQEPSSIGAVAAALFAQLGRPADPLWDPDPGALDIGVQLRGHDQLVATVMQWAVERPPAITTAPGSPGTLDLTTLGHKLRSFTTHLGHH